MERHVAIIIAGIMLLMASCGNDDDPLVCRPKALQFAGDSIAFTYDDAGHISKISYYDILRRMNKQDVLTYSTGGRVQTITKTAYPIVGQSYVEVFYTLSYENDLPKELVAQSNFIGRFTTTFTHNNEGLLVEANTSNEGVFAGGTRYEYDEAGNIPKVYYKLMINQKMTEVLARENLTFDDTEKFYNNVPELKVCNEYVYAYLPNHNNVLTAKVYYYNYSQRFVSPLSVSFQASYNEQGLIRSLETVEASWQLYSGDVLFQRVSYTCFQ